MKYFTLFCLFISFGINAQVEPNSELYNTLKKKDSLLFDVGFNNCDLATLEQILTTDLEFYHDKGGIQNKPEFLKAMKDNICSSPERKPIRKLTPGTLKVFPLYNNGELYGAIQEGTHEFYIKEPNKTLYKTSSALFSILWILESDQWKAKRIYSYNHAAE